MIAALPRSAGRSPAAMLPELSTREANVAGCIEQTDAGALEGCTEKLRHHGVPLLGECGRVPSTDGSR